MSDDEAAFLRTIRENPDADLPRLVYADWLEEQGHQLRAQFLRAHLELERLTEDSPRRRELAFWCRTQLDTQPHLLFEPPLQPKFARYGRGLIEAAEFWNASDGEIASAFQLAPLRRAWVYGFGEWYSSLLEIPDDNCLRTLDLTGNRLTADELGYAGLVRFPQLKELVLTGCDLNDEAARVLCERAVFRDLEMVRVGANPFGEEGRQRLREQFGDRVTFGSVDSRDPEVVHAIQPSEGLEVGAGNELTQLIGLACYDGYRIGIFDHAGNFIDSKDGYQMTTEQAQEECTTVLNSFGLRSGTIRVKRFGWGNGIYLLDYPTSRLSILRNDGGDHTPEELTAGREWLHNWLRDGCCKLKCYYWDVWLNRDGETTAP